MLRQGVALFAARPNFEWPGAAAVMASAVHGVCGAWGGARRLNGALVPIISAFLSGEDEWSPKPLRVNAGKSFIGAYVLGMGFTMSPDEARAYIARDPRNAEVLFPYLNGEDLNSHPEQQASRWVINFWDWPLDRSAQDGTWASSDARQQELWIRDGRVPADYPGRVAEDFPELLRIVQKTVKPERQRLDKEGNFALRSPLPQRWWHYADKRPALYHAIGLGRSFARHPDEWPGDTPMERTYSICRVTKFVAPAVCQPEQVFADRVVVLVGPSFGVFALLCSSLHECWVRKNASTFETRQTYTPTDAFETLPQPALGLESLAELGARYSHQRADYCRLHAIGLTDFYNAFHNRDRQDSALTSLRNLLMAIDHELMAAYCWGDLNLEHDFHEVASLPANDRVRFTISDTARLEVLRRLSALNRQRYQEEQASAQSLEAAQAALNTQDTSRRRPGRPAARTNASPSAQTSLFD